MCFQAGLLPLPPAAGEPGVWWEDARPRGGGPRERPTVAELHLTVRRVGWPLGPPAPRPGLCVSLARPGIELGPSGDIGPRPLCQAAPALRDGLYTEQRIVLPLSAGVSLAPAT